MTPPAPTSRPGRVAGKLVLITGAAQGLGAATAHRLAAEGARVAVTDINVDKVRAVAADLDRDFGAGTAVAFAHDVTSEAAWISVLADTVAALGGLSVLVHNAGIVGDGNIETLELASWRKQMEVNVDSIFLGTKHALAHMRKSTPASIVVMSSIAGIIASDSLPGYNASKAAAWMLSKSIALHCTRQKLDIRCNSIHPAFVDTPILDPLRARAPAGVVDGKLARQIPMGRLGTPDEIALAVLYLASDESRFMTGAELKLDGGISAM